MFEALEEDMTEAAGMEKWYINREEIVEKWSFYALLAFVGVGFLITLAIQIISQLNNHHLRISPIDYSDCSNDNLIMPSAIAVVFFLIAGAPSALCLSRGLSEARKISRELIVTEFLTVVFGSLCKNHIAGFLEKKPTTKLLLSS